MESANKDEAERCIEKAKRALKSGKVHYAHKLALKSLRLCSTPEGIEFLECVEKRRDASNASTDGRSDNVENKVGDDESTCADNFDDGEREEYTPEQEEAVRRVLSCTNYYEVLSVPRDVTDVDLKKRYKHLALALHPDKNRAPRSDDAFKAISKAYATLSDPTRRNHYDRFGEDGLHAFPATASPDSPDDYLRFVFSNDFFNFFEDGGNTRRRSFYMSNNHRSGRHFHVHHRNRRQTADDLRQFWQVLPLMMIVVLVFLFTMMSSMLATPSIFSLQRISDYTQKKVVAKYNIPYYVKASFDEKEKSRVERDVVRVYVWDLEEQCRNDRYWGVGSRSKTCKRLGEINSLKKKR